MRLAACVQIYETPSKPKEDYSTIPYLYIMKKFTLLTYFTFLLLTLQPIVAQENVEIRFNRTDASNASATVTDGNGIAIEGATATVALSGSTSIWKSNGELATSTNVICPDVNANTNPTIEMTVTINGLGSKKLTSLGLDIHALNSSGNHQLNGSNEPDRHWNVDVKANDTSFASYTDLEIARGCVTDGVTHKMHNAANVTATEVTDPLTLKLTIGKGSNNGGCFFGLEKIVLGTGEEGESKPETTLPDVDENAGKIYIISWKNTGGNYITESDNHKMVVDGYSVTKRQFWQFIPSGKENCFYIRNTATNRYIGSCNLTPASASKIYTTTEPVEYYVGKTSATSGENANCWYFSSTDCTDYDKEANGPRALNKDGASSDVITWQAGTSRVGSYWQLTETTDLYELRPFDAGEEIGTIVASYYIKSKNGSYLTINENALSLTEPDIYNDSQEWYFVGVLNSNGWQIASVASPAVTVGLQEENIIVSESNTSRWKVKASKENNGYFYFVNKDDETITLSVDGESLFQFEKIRSAYSRAQQIYNNPCGSAGNNYITSLTVAGEDVLGKLTYSTDAKPSSWHVIHSKDKACVAIGKEFNLEATLSSSPASDLLVNAYFDWNCDGVFETTENLTLNGQKATCSATVPTWAKEKQSRMRIRVNQSGLDLAEDDVEGFVYDFNIIVAQPQTMRTVTTTANEGIRGTTSLSAQAKEYAYGTTLTATATPIGNSNFICWREGATVVSTEAEYTFTVDHNIKLTAYFSPNTDEDSYTAITAATTDEEITIEQQNNTLVVLSSCEIKNFALYTINATLVAKTNSNILSTSSLSEGVYIARVTTANGYKNLKVYIKK